MSAARTRRRPATRPAGPPEPPVCRCDPQPYIVATFRAERLVAVTRTHRCSLPDEALDPVAWRDGREGAEL